MVKNKSKLSTLRRVRAIVRDELRRRLGEALEAEGVLKERGAALAAEINAAEYERRTTAASGVIDVGHLVNAHRYEVVLGAEKTALDQQTAMLAQETERRRLKLAEADSAVRAVEQLQEKRLAAERMEQRRIENRELDEVAVNGFLRRDE